MASTRYLQGGYKVSIRLLYGLYKASSDFRKVDSYPSLQRITVDTPALKL